ncbi:multidrug resistance-associated protein 7 isoform X2 [Agrilus planipennis]|uniref:ABC-type xenobiotic transporter n=1 Tax=Agrilus planipennis TaxID=224129 RepID=A0A7F5R5C2_AGRPL|nr:multidrug resistance-associated protein 7 isoform X2 [Agrilus planipennis]
MDSFQQFAVRWRWHWEDLCGADGFQIWSPKTHDLGLCFEQLCLQIPAFVLLAIASAFYFGHQVEYVARSKFQKHALNVRCLLVTILAVLPLIQIYVDINRVDVKIEKISYFLSAVEGISWFVHLGYVSVLRKRLGLSSRGPMAVCVIWTLTAVLTFISFRTHYLIYLKHPVVSSSISLSFRFSIAKLVLQICYGITLLVGQGNTEFLQNQYSGASESQPLLYNAYNGFSEERDPSYLGVAMEDSSWLRKLFFCWVDPLMKKGAQGHVNNSEDLYDVPYSLNCTTLSAMFEKSLIGNTDEILKKTIYVDPPGGELGASSSSINPEISNTKYRVSVFRALHKCFAFHFYGIGILKFASDCASFAGPMLLNLLVSFIDNKNENIKEGYLYAGGLFITTLIVAFCNAHFNFLMAMVGLKIRAAVVTAIYRKTLSVSSSVLSSQFSTGEIINFMSTDTDRIVNACPSFHALWSIPFQLAVTLYLLYVQVGLAFLAGLAFSVVLIPINKIIANKIGELSVKLMERKDERVRVMAEVLKGIRTIKLYVWEQHFIRNITSIREEELKYLKARKYLDAMCVYFWATTPVLISILTFGTYVLLGNVLTAATVFTSMALLNMLIGPLNNFPWVLNGLTEAWVSVKRIQRLFDLPDLHWESYYEKSCNNPNNEIEITSASFSWIKTLSPEEISALHSVNRKRRVKGKGKGKKAVVFNELEKVDEIEESDTLVQFHLTNISFTVKKGEFVGVIGTVGSGKSTLLFALLAELNKTEGSVAIADIEKGFSLVTQQPWLQRDTIRENILFGKLYDDVRYRRVINACSLSEDLLLFPGGDSTAVGEGGSTVSGGQKARIALARAVYQEKDVYLLDDILSAVDVKVAKHIFQHCLLGLLKNKTRILCTHHVQFLMHCDKIVVLKNGTIDQIGVPQEVLSNIDASLPIDLELEESTQSTDTTEESGIIIPESTDNDSILNEEFSESGTVKFRVYSEYWKAVGHLLSVSIIIAMTIMQTSRNITDLWLSYWVSNSETKNTTNISSPFKDDENHLALWSTGDLFRTDNTVQHYMMIYGLFAGLNTIFTFIRAFLFAYGGICAASKIHKLLLKSVMKSKVPFFDVTSVGRILNRFSSDTYTVDDSLPFIMNILLAQFFGVIGSMIVTIYGLPWLSLIMVPIVPIYFSLQNHYRLTSRQLKRISSVTLSPIYGHFNETLQGLPTIRALRANQRFKRDNEEKVEANMKAKFASQAASQWLGLRLQFIGVAMVTGVGFIAVVQHQFDFADPGLVGLAISYSLSITNLLNGVVNAFTETEREMIAVERVNEYIEKITPETSHFVCDPPYAWPAQGVVVFNNVVLKYREHLSPSLKGVSFETRPAEKIGVVGRTGAGKSSLITALLRLVELYAGSIIIDTVNIAHLSLQALRSRIFCIPQEPFLFSGTIRENLDPLDEFRDQELWSALSKVDLGHMVRNLGGLDYKIASAGSNLSVGQKQLFCLARAILHNAKIVCVDEATANVDQETDRQIQQTLRSAFRMSTVITIAHRIETIMDCDRILVMKDGQAVEFDTPQSLMDDFNSHFHQMVNHD